MKNKIAFALTFIFILTSLASCIASGNKTTKSSGENASEDSVISEISGSEFTQIIYHEKLFDCFKDKSVAELEVIFNKYNVITYNYGRPLTNTPTFVLIPYNNKKEQSFTVYSYNKQSGIITYACPDPLCDHVNCVFGHNYQNSVYSGGFIYIICDSSYLKDDGSGEYINQMTIYRTDTTCNNPEKLYEADNISLISSFKGNFYFISTVMNEDNKVIHRLTEIDKPGNIKYVSPKGLYIIQYIVNNDGIYYEDGADASLYFTADGFKTSHKLIENIGSFTVADDYLFYGYLASTDIDGLYRSSVDGTGEITVSEIIGNNYLYNNGYIYYINGENYNEMWRIKFDGTDNELVFVSETNGQPDEFDWYLIEGSLCYALCITCVDKAEAEKSHKGNQNHFTVYDMTTGEKFFIDPDF